MGNSNEFTQFPYRFFELSKDALASLFKLISTYKNNILKIAGNEALQLIIRKLFSYLMESLVVEMFNRLKKYFEIDSIDRSKINNKSKQRLESYISEFYAIWNQIERLKYHLMEEIPETYHNYRSYLNDLDNVVNS